MDKLERLLKSLTDYEVQWLDNRLKDPSNREKAEKMTKDKLAYDIVYSLSWHYKGLWDDDLPDGNSAAERRDFLWAKAKELGLKDE